MPTVELRFTPVPAHVRTARLVAAALARRAGVDESVVDEVKLAVGEACGRAVDVQAARGADVVVLFTDDDAAFAVAVRDDGSAEPEVPPLDALVEGAVPPGIGLAVIAGLVDDFDVVSSPDGTVVRMVWAAS